MIRSVPREAVMGSVSKTQRFMKGAKDRTIRAEEIHTRMPCVLHKTLGVVGRGGNIGIGDFLKRLLYYYTKSCGASLVAQMVKNLPATRKTQVLALGQEDPLEEGMATHSSILAWRIPWTEEPGGLQSMGSQESDMT